MKFPGKLRGSIEGALGILQTRTGGMKAGFSRYLRASAGNIAISASLALPALMGAVGLASDYAQFVSKKSELQAAADAAAVAAAKELSVASATDTTITAAAEAFASASIRTDITTTVKIGSAHENVTVEVREDWVPFFAHYLGAEITPVIVHAAATLVGQSSVCVLTLDKSAASALKLDNKSTLTANGCGVYVNSTDPKSIDLKNKSLIQADLTCTAGGVSNKGTITPAALTDCPAIEDPLNSRGAPPVGSCDHSNMKITSGAVTLAPGVYCNGLEIKGNANVTLEEGTYIFLDGPFRLAGNATLSGTHVGFYFTGIDAKLEFVGNTSVSLTGPAGGVMAGLLIYGDRNAPTIMQHVIRSTNAHTLTGTIYLPRGDLRVDPGSQVGQNSAYTAIVANKIDIDQGPELVLNSDYDATDVPAPIGIKTSAQVVLSE